MIVKHRSVNVESNALWSIYMFTYLRNIGPYFIHGIFLFSKVWVFVAKFDGLFAFAYSSLILWSWPLERAWYHYTSSFSNLYLKGCQLCPTFCFLRKGWSQPYYVFLDCPTAWSCPPKCSIWVFFSDEAKWKKVWLFKRNCFQVEILKFQSYSKHRNHFDIGLKQTRYEEIQVVPIDRFSEVMKTFCFVFGENIKWYFVGQRGSNFNLKVTGNRSSKHSFCLYE